MTYSLRTLSRALFACVVFVSLTSALHAQTNTPGTIMWPAYPPVGIGTVGSGSPQNALQIHHNPGVTGTWPAILRLSDGANDSINIFGALALMPDMAGFPFGSYSSLAQRTDLVLHENAGGWGGGNLILTNLYDSLGAIRMATTPAPSSLPLPGPFVPKPDSDVERVTILANGNVGVDLPEDSTTHLAMPKDQFQIGGGTVPYSGNLYPTPGLTIYGGNRFENMPRQAPDTGLFPGDWRYIAFNKWTDHTDTSSSRSHRFQPISCSQISFAETNGGLLDLSTFPYDSARGLNDFTHGATMELQGNGGLFLWTYESASDPYHHLFDVYRPGYDSSSVRNKYGLCYHHTPVYIGTDSTNVFPNFTNFAHVNPDIGDGQTWMLAVSGAGLFKEIFVLDSTWADYVFLPGYKLKPISEVENFTIANHHLPDIPSAQVLAKTGVPVGRTMAAMTKQLEDEMLYIEQLSKQNEILEKQNETTATALKKLEAEVESLKNRKEK